MGSKRAFNRQTIYFAGSCPSFRGPKNNRRPARAGLGPVRARFALNAPNPSVALIQSSREFLMNEGWVCAFHEERIVTSGLQQRFHFVIAGAAECRRPGNLVSIQMQDRQDSAIARGVQIFYPFPRSGERTCFRFAITNHSGNNELGIIESSSECVR